MKGGAEHNVIDKYYLCTASRYDKPFDTLIPFGNLTNLYLLYGNNKDLDNIESMAIDIPDKKILGFSMYGIYFRLIEKEKINEYNKYKTDDEEFTQTRSFIFDFGKFLEYVVSKTNVIPLFFYNKNNYSGIEYDDNDRTNVLRKDIIGFLNDIENKIQDNYLHELVCRIPIKLDKKTGFIGKINKNILHIMNSKQRLEYEEQLKERLKEQKEQQDLEFEEEMEKEKILEKEQQRCNNYENQNQCMQNNCFYDIQNKKCNPTYKFITSL